MTAHLDRARAAAAEGEVGGVREAFEAASASGLDAGELEEWLLLLGGAGEAELARALAERWSDERARARVQELIDGGEDPPPDDGADELDLELQRLDERAKDRRIVELFSRWFSGRRDLYARQWYDEARRRGGYRPVREPLTLGVVRQHLEGRITIGQYLLGPDACAHFGVLDLDLDANALAELRAARGEEAAPLQHEALRRYTRELIAAGRSLAVPLFPEDSGGRGVHLWAFFEPRRPSRTVRAVLGQIAAAAGGPPPEVGLEIFPKQERTGPSGLSSLVKLPCGVHQATLRRCHLLDEELQPLEDLEAALTRLRAAPPDVIDALAGRRLVPLPAPELVLAPAPPPPAQVRSARSLGSALRALGSGPAARAGAERMLEGCDALAALVRKAHTERRLSAAEARAIAYTLGLVGDRCELADAALRSANAGLKELERARRGLPSPMGCGKLRELTPGGRCAGCPSGRDAVPYATPALFAVGAVEPSPPRHARYAEALGGEGPIVETPLETIGRALERIEERLVRLEREKGAPK